MAEIKFTKIELAKYKKKKSLFMKYLPTLQLKKMLLQTEVFKAQAEINSATEAFERELQMVEKEAALLTDPDADAVRDQVCIERVEITTENVAGIEVPSLQSVVFKEVDISLMIQPIWVEDLVSMIKLLKEAYQKVNIAKKKKTVLEKELRVISTRVNLFEKRLIPETTKIIGKITIFLSDQELQFVSTAKISKKKILQKKELKVI